MKKSAGLTSLQHKLGTSLHVPREGAPKPVRARGREREWYYIRMKPRRCGPMLICEGWLSPSGAATTQKSRSSKAARFTTQLNILDGGSLHQPFIHKLRYASDGYEWTQFSFEHVAAGDRSAAAPQKSVPRLVRRIFLEGSTFLANEDQFLDLGAYFKEGFGASLFRCLICEFTRPVLWGILVGEQKKFKHVGGYIILGP